MHFAFLLGFWFGLFGCGVKSSQSASLRIADGIEVSNTDFPAVVKIFSADPVDQAAVGTCTATWVSSETLLTAAHCISSESGTEIQRVWVKHPATGSDVVADPANIRIHPRYGEISLAGTFDIAIIRFSESVSSHALSMVDLQAKAGDQVQLVGFGITRVGGYDAGVKRFGINTIESLDGKKDSRGVGRPQDLIFIRGVLNQAVASEAGLINSGGAVNLQGDSGGPLLHQGRLLGVASTAELDDPTQLGGSYVSTFVHRDWLRQSGYPICGLTLPCEGAPRSNDEARVHGGVVPQRN
jgi:secreted trypsin-like serine protease